MALAPPIVCFGAGNLGRRVARAVRPVLMCDNNRALWHTFVDGIPVESPQTAVELYPNATFVVAIWHPSRTETMMDRIRQLQSLGASEVIPFHGLFGEYRDHLLPRLFWEEPDYYAKHKDEIARGRALLDEKGQIEFDRQMRLRLGDFTSHMIDPGTQYFPTDLFALSRHEVFVDCGAYDGDTIAEFREATGDQFDRIIAFEPDAENFKALKSSVSEDSRITLHPCAVDSARKTVRFAVGGTGARISSTGSCEIETITLDEVLEGTKPSYIKFDIEGSEPDALKGGRKTITSHRPKLAVCAYHAPDHLWSIPLQLRELVPDSLLTLRGYCADGFDCVCYCVPR